MDEMKYALLTEVLGRWNADILENFLESEGIEVVLIQDSISPSTYSLSFSAVQVYVPKENIERAHELLKTFDDGLNTDEQQKDEEDQ